jgi:ABC-2 type transport system permease protein
VSEYLSIALGLAWRVLHKIFRNPSLLAPQLIFPLFFFTAFVGGLSRVNSLPGFDYPPGYTAFQFVFVLLQSAAFGGVFTGFGIASDFEYGFARRLFLAAPRRSALIVGYGIAAVGRWALTGGLLTAVAMIAGMEVGGDGVDIVALYTLALIINIAALLWACGIAMRIRSLQSGPVMQLPVFLILFLAPVYFRSACSRAGCTRLHASTRSRRCSRPGVTSSPAGRCTPGLPSPSRLRSPRGSRCGPCGD